MKTKVCTKCEIEKELSEFYKCNNRGKYGVNSRCKKCSNILHSEWVSKNRDKVNKTQEIYNRKNKKLLAKKARLNLKEKSKNKKWNANLLLKKRIYNNNITSELGDSYIKSQLTHNSKLKYKDIPIELVELKRIQLKLHRELRK